MSDFPQLQFDDFLAKMRQQESFALTRYFKSFLNEFLRNKWSISEKQRIVQDFLVFMSQQQTPLFPDKDVFLEGLEKLTCIKLYEHLYSTESDAEVDGAIEFICKLHAPWIGVKHFDIQENESATQLASTELAKMNNFKSPRDKLISVVNCCKLLLVDDRGADDLMPALIYSILKTKHEGLYSNIQFISRFRAEEKLKSEAGYYLTTLHAAIGFILNISQQSLTWKDEDYSQHVALVLQGMDEKEIVPDEGIRQAQKIFSDDSNQEPPDHSRQTTSGSQISQSRASFTTSRTGSRQGMRQSQSQASFLTPVNTSERLSTLKTQMSGVFNKIFSGSQSGSQQSTPQQKRSLTKELYDAAIEPFVGAPQYPAQQAQAQPSQQQQTDLDFEMQMALAMSLSIQETAPSVEAPVSPQVGKLIELSETEEEEAQQVADYKAQVDSPKAEVAADAEVDQKKDDEQTE